MIVKLAVHYEQERTNKLEIIKGLSMEYIILMFLKQIQIQTKCLTTISFMQNGTKQNQKEIIT